MQALRAIQTFTFFLYWSGNSCTGKSKNTVDDLGDFTGANSWRDAERFLCDNPILSRMKSETVLSKNPHLKCYCLMQNLQIAKFEILNHHPPVALFHDTSTKETRRGLLNLGKKKVESLHVQREGREGAAEQNELRVVNGTFVHPLSNYFSKKISKRLQFLTGFNMTFTEYWNVLFYRTGGHYALHHDHKHFLYPPNKIHDRKLKEEYRVFGNRIATVILGLKRSDKGGATIFPYLNFSFILDPGDAVLWFNARPNGARDDATVHGGCPIIAGHKSIVAIWINERNQEFTVKCPLRSNSYDISSFYKGALSLLNFKKL